MKRKLALGVIALLALGTGSLTQSANASSQTAVQAAKALPPLDCTDPRFTPTTVIVGPTRGVVADFKFLGCRKPFKWSIDNNEINLHVADYDTIKTFDPWKLNNSLAGRQPVVWSVSSGRSGFGESINAFDQNFWLLHSSSFRHHFTVVQHHTAHHGWHTRLVANLFTANWEDGDYDELSGEPVQFQWSMRGVTWHTVDVDRTGRYGIATGERRDAKHPTWWRAYYPGNKALGLAHAVSIHKI